MKKFTIYFEKIRQSWKQELEETEVRENDLRIRFQKLRRICRNVLIKLNYKLHEKPFPDKVCEIHFFKRIKPEIMARYIFYQKVYWLHTAYFKGSAILERKRLERERSNIERFFWENQTYYAYYLNDCTHHDEVYFVRGQYDEKICPPVNHFDTHFSTSFDGMLAEMMAKELLLEYVEERLSPASLVPQLAGNNIPLQADREIRWTASKTDLVEIGYCLYAAGSVNNGNATIEAIMQHLSVVFKKDLKDYSRLFYQIRSRKGNLTEFIDKLKVDFIKHNDELDQPKTQRKGFISR